MNAYVLGSLVWLVLTVLMVIAMDQLTRRRNALDAQALDLIADGRPLSLSQGKDQR